MKRRDIITIATVAGLDALVGEPAEVQASVGPPQPQQVGQWFNIVITVFAIWKSLPENAKADIWSWLKREITGVGRTASVTDEGSSGSPNGGIVRIKIKIGKHKLGHLTVDGHLANLDGGSHPHVTHSGTAAHHRHPDMQSHLRQIVKKADAFLRQRNM
jgi:hypothetical protein